MGKGRLMTPGVSLFILFTCIPRRRYQERLCQATNWYQPFKLCQRVGQIGRADAAVPEIIVFHSIPYHPSPESRRTSMFVLWVFQLRFPTISPRGFPSCPCARRV
ncbi:hypothetical protein AGABI2DRAFT_195247 [Agaricus bisporus var. bisporus H97]|uniref:hypothetical protein n=1 Tax=Agaricus bisporus var. bisporus (strain H97 / ATCC MYA-4626 / FGSC 10389) TaxID=936046 RepID=UPI00029F6CFE|nr:hypothetical protein AGABI2DRAFT_195247 [Agaricus bisporus var. bisporus H97]EKV43738.1 hypothetical protein AGABI2DRAFT_195247 [Agaricus bisporus var. bisporus H97]